MIGWTDHGSAAFPYRLPAFGRPNWPFKISYRLHKKTSDITLTMTGPVAWTKDLLRALDLLTGLAEHLKHWAEAAERHQRIDAQALAWRIRVAEMQQAYDAARQSGLLHRAAIRTLLEDPKFQDLKWSFSDFNRMISNPTRKRDPSLSTDPLPLSRLKNKKP